MNTNNKLKELGFIKTKFYKPNEYQGDNMILDDTAREWGVKKDGSKGWVEVPKIHPKSNSFWKLQFNENYIIWVSVVNNTIHTIWLDNLTKVKSRMDKGITSGYLGYMQREEYLKTIYRYSDISKITSKRQIIGLFPTEIKRDFLIRDLLK